MITADDREVMQHPEIPTLLPDVNVQRLESGDYAFLDYSSNPVGVERCEINNLIQKLGDGQLESQLRIAQDQYNEFWLLVEGVWDKETNSVQPYSKRKINMKGHQYNVYFESRKHGFFQYDRLESILVRLAKMGIQIKYTPNFDCSMNFIRILHAKSIEDNAESKLFKSSRGIVIPSKFSSNPAVPRLLALCPRMPETVAIQLIADYGSIIGVIMANPMDVPDFGKVLQRRLRENVGLVTQTDV